MLFEEAACLVADCTRTRASSGLYSVATGNLLLCPLVPRFYLLPREGFFTSLTLCFS